MAHIIPTPVSHVVFYEVSDFVDGNSRPEISNFKTAKAFTPDAEAVVFRSEKGDIAILKHKCITKTLWLLSKNPEKEFADFLQTPVSGIPWPHHWTEWWESGYTERDAASVHVCEYIDPGFGHNLWCKFDGCSSQKKKFGG